MTEYTISKVHDKGISSEGLKVEVKNASIDDESVSICNCAHLVDYHDYCGCLINGCPCTNFTAYRVKKPKLRQWRGSW